MQQSQDAAQDIQHKFCFDEWVMSCEGFTCSCTQQGLGGGPLHGRQQCAQGSHHSHRLESRSVLGCQTAAAEQWLSPSAASCVPAAVPAPCSIPPLESPPFAAAYCIKTLAEQTEGKV